MTDLTLYDYAPSANCMKVRILLAQLGKPHRRVPVDIFAGDPQQPEFVQSNPLSRTPVLELPGGEAIFESNAILLHLAEGTEYLPSDPVARARVHQWLFVEQNNVEPMIGGARFWRLTGRAERIPELFASAVKAGERSLDALERHLDGREWFAGDAYTIADLSLWAYAHLAPDAGIDLASRPRVREWISRVEGTPGFVDDLEPYPENAMAGRGSRPGP